MAGIDRWGYFYLQTDKKLGDRIVTVFEKCNPQGQIVTTIGPLEPSGVHRGRAMTLTFISDEGIVYVFSWNSETKDAYRVFRWQRQ